jgi:hypothetical protein
MTTCYPRPRVGSYWYNLRSGQYSRVVRIHRARHGVELVTVRSARGSCNNSWFGYFYDHYRPAPSIAASFEELP